MAEFQKTSALLIAGLVMTLTACSSAWQSSMPIQNGNYVPDVRLEGDGLRQYHADVALCQKQILKQYEDKYLSNNAITDLRHCLILKGYVLLS